MKNSKSGAFCGAGYGASHDFSDGASTEAGGYSNLHSRITSPAYTNSEEAIFLDILEPSKLASIQYAGGRYPSRRHPDPSREDHHLLTILGEIARGAPDDFGSCGPNDVSAQFIVDMQEIVLPTEVCERDPHVQELRRRCAETRKCLEWQWGEEDDIRLRLENELQSIKRRQDIQQRESFSVVERARGAQQLLNEQLAHASRMKQAIENRVADESYANDCLDVSLTQDIARLSVRAKELFAEVTAVGEDQTRLIEEFRHSTDVQSSLQNDLQAARISSRRQSTDVVRSFAKGGAPAGALSALEHASLVAAKSLAETVTSPLEELLLPKGAHSDPQEHVGLWAEKSAWLQARVAGAEELAELEHTCWRQARQVAELGKELALESSSKTQTIGSLETLKEHAEGMNLPFACAQPKAVDDELLPQEGGGLDLSRGWQELDATGCAIEAKGLRESLDWKRGQREQESSLSQDFAHRLGSDREMLHSLRIYLEQERSKKISRDDALGEASAHLDELRTSLEEDNVSLREEMDHTEEQEKILAKELSKKRAEFKAGRHEVKQLKGILKAELSSGCCRRRRQPSQTNQPRRR